MSKTNFPDRSREPVPSLFDYVPKNVWREVYHGRWAQLTRVQQAEFVIEIAFLVMFFGGLAYLEHLRTGGLIGLVLAFGAVGAVLATFFFLLTRFIR